MELTKKPKIAIVHDWLTNFAGAEQVTLALMEMFPDAPLYTSVFKPKSFPKKFSQRNVHTSSLQKYSYIPHQLLYPKMGKAFESFDLSAYDIVISSSHASSKGVITKPETLHICYCHTPTRYLWSHYFEYLDQMQFGIFNPIIRWRFPKTAYRLRIWDKIAAERPDFWIANSDNTAKRIKKYYRKESKVIYPPVNTDFFEFSEKKEEFYLAASRLIPYKKIDLVVDAFGDLGLPLKVIGDGPERKNLEKTARKNVEILGRVSDEELKKYYQKAKAFVFPAEEDFGIVPIEAMASGTPVIAFNKGGATETVTKRTGVFFNKQTKSSLMKAISEFEKREFNHKAIREYALNFSKIRFKEEMGSYVNQKYNEFQHERQ